MSSTVRSDRDARVSLGLLALVALLAVVGHFVADAACAAAEAPGRALCGTGATGRASDSLRASCSWHAAFVLTAVLAITAPLVLTVRQRLARPQALFVLFPLPLLPPKATLTA
jgi:hypothetical protein